MFRVRNANFYDFVHRIQQSGTITGELLVDVPCSGRDGAFGFGSSYNHPEFLVVEFRIDDNPKQPSRMCFSIPEGRGPRTVTIGIP